jgi:hypothetical protein
MEGHGEKCNAEEIVKHPGLSFDKKRELLHRWAFEAYRVEVIAAKAPPPYGRSRLDQVIDALIALEEAAVTGSGAACAA